MNNHEMILHLAENITKEDMHYLVKYLIKENLIYLKNSIQHELLIRYKEKMPHIKKMSKSWILRKEIKNEIFKI